jgi:hypothetical protein
MPKSSNSQKQWGYFPGKTKPVAVPAALKQEVEQKANELVETVLKPRHLLPPPENPQFNYIEDIYTKWYRSFFYFCTRYRVAGPNSLAEHFESKFTRMKYTGAGHFDLAYMRYTNQWVDVYTGLTLDECIESIRNDPWFQP